MSFQMPGLRGGNYLSWSGGTSATMKPHACHCIGCCRRCGTCVTWPGHTAAYCDLLVRQKQERANLLAQRRASSPPPPGVSG